MGRLSPQDVSRMIAEDFGDDGFYPADRCPQGHDVSHLKDRQIGDLCPMCSERIGRGEPYPFGERMGEIMAEIEEWARQHHIQLLRVEPAFVQRPQPRWDLRVLDRSGRQVLELHINNPWTDYGPVLKGTGGVEPV